MAAEQSTVQKWLHEQQQKEYFLKLFVSDPVFHQAFDAEMDSCYAVQAGLYCAQVITVPQLPEWLTLYRVCGP